MQLAIIHNSISIFDEVESVPLYTHFFFKILKLFSQMGLKCQSSGEEGKGQHTQILAWFGSSKIHKKTSSK